MSRGFQKLIIQGNLGNDPDIRFMPNGNQVTSISIATSEEWKDSNGKDQKRTEWHKVICYRGLAEVTGKCLKKGNPVLVECKLKTRKWQDSNGNNRHTQDIIADGLTLISTGEKYTEHDNQAPKAGYQKPAPVQKNEKTIEKAIYITHHDSQNKNATHEKSFKEIFPDDDSPPF